MSLINQMLQDLEKRRASNAERGALPNQVRVLPRAEKSGAPWWLLGIGVAVAVIAALAWQLNNRPEPSPPVPVARVAPAAPPPVKVPLQLAGPASRLALDLEKVPPPVATKPAVPARAEPKAAIAKTEPPPQPKPSKAFDKTPKTPPAVAGVAAETVPQAKQQPMATSTVIATQPAAAAKPVPAPPKSDAVKPAPAIGETAKPASQPATVAAASAKPAAPSPKSAESSGEMKAQAALANPQIDKRSQQLTAPQLAENEYRNAANLLNQGRLVEAQDGFRLALEHNPAHIGARQGLFGLLVEAKKNAEAERVLQEGLKLNSNQPNFAMLLANMQYERGDVAGAIETLQKTEPAALANPDYLARLAALLQRQSRHQEAIDHYQAALRLAPQSGVWLMGLGLSLQAVGRNADAQDAFRRAKASNTLNPELQAFVDQRLRQLQ